MEMSACNAVTIPVSKLGTPFSQTEPTNDVDSRKKYCPKERLGQVIDRQCDEPGRTAGGGSLYGSLVGHCFGRSLGGRLITEIPALDGS